jgi:hypothetical protein
VTRAAPLVGALDEPVKCVNTGASYENAVASVPAKYSESKGFWFSIVWTVALSPTFVGTPQLKAVAVDHDVVLHALPAMCTEAVVSLV